MQALERQARHSLDKQASLHGGTPRAEESLAASLAHALINVRFGSEADIQLGEQNVR